LTLATAAGILAGCRQQESGMEYYLYVSGTADGRLSRFLMDGSSGRLQPQESIETPAPVGPMAIDRAG